MKEEKINSYIQDVIKKIIDTHDKKRVDSIYNRINLGMTNELIKKYINEILLQENKTELDDKDIEKIANKLYDYAMHQNIDNKRFEKNKYNFIEKSFADVRGYYKGILKISKYESIKSKKKKDIIAHPIDDNYIVFSSFLSLINRQPKIYENNVVQALSKTLESADKDNIPDDVKANFMARLIFCPIHDEKLSNNCIVKDKKGNITDISRIDLDSEAYCMHEFKKESFVHDDLITTQSLLLFDEMFINNNATKIQNEIIKMMNVTDDLIICTIDNCYKKLRSNEINDNESNKKNANKNKQYKEYTKFLKYYHSLINNIIDAKTKLKDTIKERNDEEIEGFYRACGFDIRKNECIIKALIDKVFTDDFIKKCKKQKQRLESINNRQEKERFKIISDLSGIFSKDDKDKNSFQSNNNIIEYNNNKNEVDNCSLQERTNKEIHTTINSIEYNNDKGFETFGKVSNDNNNPPNSNEFIATFDKNDKNEVNNCSLQKETNEEIPATIHSIECNNNICSVTFGQASNYNNNPQNSNEFIATFGKNKEILKSSNKECVKTNKQSNCNYMNEYNLNNKLGENIISNKNRYKKSNIMNLCDEAEKHSQECNKLIKEVDNLVKNKNKKKNNNSSKINDFLKRNYYKYRW